MTKWYRKYLAPFGRNIGHCDVCYLQVADLTVAINKHFKKSGRVKFYTSVLIGYAKATSTIVRDRTFKGIVTKIKSELQ